MRLKSPPPANIAGFILIFHREINASGKIGTLPIRYIFHTLPIDTARYCRDQLLLSQLQLLLCRRPGKYEVWLSGKYETFLIIKLSIKRLLQHKLVVAHSNVLLLPLAKIWLCVNL